MDRSLADRLIVLQVHEHPGRDDEAVAAAAAHLGVTEERVLAALERAGRSELYDEDGYPVGVHHRIAGPDQRTCESCAYFVAGRCEMFDLPTGADETCDEWTATR